MRSVAVVGVLLAAGVGLVGCNPFAPTVVTFSSVAQVKPGVTPGRADPANGENPLLAARRGHKVVPAARVMGGRKAPDAPPKSVFQLVKYTSPAGDLAAYLTPDPKDGQKRPAIIWITGGDCNSIDDVWSKAPADNDQTAAQYRQAGVVMMFPSLRGGNMNPGRREGYFGEVDDVLAAKKFLADQPHVDPKRVYLGGHSTGGTLALLVAETGADFRGVFSFGPVDDVAGYGPQYCPFDLNDEYAVKLRSPSHWLSGVRCRTLVIEGQEQGNMDSLMRMNATNLITAKNDHVLFYGLIGGNHFSVLAPLNEYLAKQIVADTGPACEIALPDKKPIGKITPLLLNTAAKR